MAYGDEQEQDFGMGGGGLGGIGPDTRAGPDNPDMPSPDVIAAIADQLNAAADVSADNWVGADDSFGPTAFAGYPNQRGITAPFAGYPNQTGITESSNIDRVQALRAEQQALNDRMEREIAAVEELNRVNRLSVGASNVTQPWDNPYAGANPYAGLGEYRAPAPTTGSYWEGGFNPELDNYASDWGNVTQGMNPQGIPRYSSPTSPEGALTSTSPEFSSPFSPEGALTAGWTGTSPVGEVEAAIGPPGQLGPTAVQLDMGSGYQPSPFTSPTSPEGALAGPANPYDIARNASLAFDEYDRPSRQQQERAASVAASPFDAGVMPGGLGPQFDSTMNMDAGVMPSAIAVAEGEGILQGPENIEIERTIAGIVAEGEGILQGPVTKVDLEKVSTQADLEKLVKTDVLEKSKRLTKDEKKANVAVRRKAEEDYVAFRDELNFRVEIARSALATAENTHGKKSKEAKDAKRNVRNKEADLRMWERSDLYSKSYGKVNRPGMGQGLPFVGTALSMFASIEDYFHSLGKTERRSPEEVLKDMKDNPEKYERVGAEISAAQLVRNMYSFLRKAPMDVAAAAAREPAYLRYLINLNVNKQPIPTSYSSNWKNDISDAWIYG